MAKSKKTANLKDAKFNRKSFTVFVVLFAVVGSYFILRSYAASTPRTDFVGSSNVSSISTGVTTVPAIINQVGSQSVSELAPGAKLVYNYTPSSFSSVCYYVNVLPLKGGGTTAKAEFTSPSSNVTTNLAYSSNSTNDYQSICLNPGRKANLGFNVTNLSPSTGPDILVYQEAVNL